MTTTSCDQAMTCRGKRLANRVIKATAKYENAVAQMNVCEARLKALLQQQKAVESKADRKQRTSILIDLGLAMVELYKAMGPEYRPNWYAQACVGLGGRALEKREVALKWLDAQCAIHDATMLGK